MGLMLTPNDELVETIQRALEAATPGKWIITDNPLAPEYLKVIDNLKGNIGKSILTEDAHLIANAPEWLRALLEERERLKREYDEVNDHRKIMQDMAKEREDQLQQTREDLRVSQIYHAREKEYRKEAQVELEQVKAELSKYKGESQ